MTTAIPHTHHIFDLSYVSSIRQDFKHLSGTEHHFKDPKSDLSFALNSIANTYLSRHHPRSMVKAEGPSSHKKSSPRSAGQATSPHNIAENTVSGFSCNLSSSANKGIRFPLRLLPAA